MSDLLTPASQMPADDMAIAEARTRSRGELLDKLAQAINFTSTENASNTPDFILANFAAACLDAFAEASVAREAWYGKSLSIGGEASDIAALEARTPAPADDPEMDGTDFAHPAWWRGHEHTTAMFCHAVNEILDGKDDGVGVNAEGPWCDTRKRLLALMGKPAPALPADVEALLADAGYKAVLAALRQEAVDKCGGGFGAPDLNADYQLSLSLLVREVYQILNIEQHIDALATALRETLADLAAARKELAGLGPVEQEVSIFGVSAYRPRMEFDSPDMQVRAIRRVLEGGAQ